MSAYIVNPQTLARIAAAANGNTYYTDEARQTKAYADAVTLLKENIASVAYRYDDCPDNEDAIGYWFTDLNYKTYLEELTVNIQGHIILQHRKGVRADVMKDAKQVWDSVNEYIYQSCEHEEWEGSKAHFIALSAGHNVAHKLLDEDRFGRYAS